MKSQRSNVAFLIAGLILAAAAYRVCSATIFPGLPNFSPVMAIAFCGGMFLTGAAAWVVPVAALLASDILLAVALGYPVVSGGAVAAWVCTLAAVGLGRWMASGSRGPLPVLGGLLGSGILFYVVTNTVSWLGNPAYAKSFSGLVQSLTTGLPGYPPTWMFFRNSVVSDLIFGAAIVAVWALATRTGRRSTAIREA